ncbi:MAG: hypothetical protein HFH75_09125 [Lachnospiraceae bacterium]|jgi:serine O-acetyltransferase|nr:hypothetical protein [Lachnospiraceae bacterium]
MHLSLPPEDLKTYLGRQLEMYFPDGLTEKYFQGKDVDRAFDEGIERLEYCFKHINLVAYSNDRGDTFFSHLHADQYSQFLYYFMNTLWKKSENEMICKKVMLLNRALSGLFVSYKCELPDIYLTYHAVGTVLGDAGYSDYFMALQNVTINTGAKENGTCTPRLGKGLFMAAGSSIIGTKTIGEWVSVGAGARVYDQEIADHKLVVNRSGKQEILENHKCGQRWYWRIF